MGVILKNVYEKQSDFVEFTTLLGKKRLQYHLTDKAYLLPPNMRTISRFMSKHSIASEAFCMNQVTFALQNIKIRLWQAVKILKGYWNFITRSPRQVAFR